VPKRLPYEDGDCFAVPLRNGGYGVGLVARHDGRGGVVGYLFGPRTDEIPTLDDVAGLRARDAVRVVRFGDLGLVRGKWPILGRLDGWLAEDWPLPDFGRRGLDGTFRVIYSTDHLAGPALEERISDHECNRLPRDALSGAGAVERVLTSLLSS
jgi:hypothetical protein